MKAQPTHRVWLVIALSFGAPPAALADPSARNMRMTRESPATDWVDRV
jgi:hypothetical protein